MTCLLDFSEGPAQAVIVATMQQVLGAEHPPGRGWLAMLRRGKRRRHLVIVDPAL
jgi:hypothetical protein